MDIEYCNELVVLADHLNFRKAADRLFITQSTLSKHVATAEKEAGFKIFDRSTVHVELTDSGKVYINHIRSMIDSYSAALREGKSQQDELDTTVHIVGPIQNVTVMALIAEARNRIASLDGNIKLALVDVGVRDCVSNLYSANDDLAFTFRHEACFEGVISEYLFDVPFGIVCHDSHWLAQKESISFEDLKNEKLVSYPLNDRAGYHQYVSEVCAKYGIGSSIEHLEDGVLCFPYSKDVVVFGIYFSGYANYGSDLVARPLDDLRDVFEVYVSRRVDETNPAVLSYFDQIVESSRELYSDSGGLTPKQPAALTSILHKSVEPAIGRVVDDQSMLVLPEDDHYCQVSSCHEDIE